MHKFDLPDVIRLMVNARNKVRDHYWEVLGRGGHEVGLDFTLDGNLVGDIGESLAVEMFGIRLVDSKSHPGIDGYSRDGRTVQIKATGRGLGPAFRLVETRANHLLFFDLNFDECSGTVFYNGPEQPVVATLPAAWVGQRVVSRKRLQSLQARLSEFERLPLL